MLRYLLFQVMSEEQLEALLAKLKGDAVLRKKLKGAADLDAFVAMAQEAGFDVSKADWMKYQARQTLELRDEELEGMAGAVDNGRLRQIYGPDWKEMMEPGRFTCL